MSSLRWSRLGVIALATLLVAWSAGADAASAWRWTASGTLGRTVTCLHAGTRYLNKSCSYRIPDAPRAPVRETGVIKVSNPGSRDACYGVSISSTYMAGLRRLCVKATSTGRLRFVGPARHFRSTRLSIFVTVASNNRPIHPITSTSRSRFTITFSQP
ncbi:MAG TPA: hypothetical protein VMV53_02500 [Acidimicrobiales bacterium]|nr:hypothetical protein [Acidimicrobiales bacterium]